MLRQDIRLPDVDPAIAQAGVTSAPPTSGALKAAILSIGVIALLVVLNSAWAHLLPIERSQHVELTPAPLFLNDPLF